MIKCFSIVLAVFSRLSEVFFEDDKFLTVWKRRKGNLAYKHNMIKSLTKDTYTITVTSITTTRIVHRYHFKYRPTST